MRTPFFDKRPSFDGVPSFLMVFQAGRGHFEQVSMQEFATFRTDSSFAYCNVPGINPFQGFTLGNMFFENGSKFSGSGTDDRLRAEPNPLGCHIVAAKQKSGYAFSMDAYGQGALFYGEINGSTFVTNRLLLLAEYFHAVGHKLNLNLGAALLQFSSDSAIAMHAMTRETVFEHFKALLPGDKLTVSLSGGAKVEESQRDFSLLTYEAYREGLVDCAERMANRLSSATNNFSTVTVSLTAGVDSRAMLALSLAVVGAENTRRFTIPVRPIDSFGSLHLGEKYGVSASNDLQSDFQEIDVARYIESNSIEWFGVNNEILLPNLSASLGSGLRIGGAGGEVHRTFYRKRFLTFPNYSFEYTDGTGKQFFRQIFSGKLSTTSAEMMEVVFVKELDRLPGHTLADKMEYHYYAYRNRFHFRGQLGRKTSGGRLAVSPLLDGDLLKLSSRTSVSFKDSDQILLDLSEVWQPGITDIAYNSDLAAEHGITVDTKFRGAKHSQFDMGLPESLRARQKELRAKFVSELEDLTTQALDVLAQSNYFTDVVEHGRKRIKWITTLSGHNFQFVWPMRMIALARLVSYAK